MKKFLAVTLSMLMILNLVSCSKKKDKDVDETEIETEKETTEDTAGMANPWIEVSAGDVKDYLGFKFGVPEDAENVKYYWCESLGIAEMQFRKFGIEYVARAKKTGALEDISGMNYDFKSNSDNYGHGPDVFIWNSDRELRGEWHVLILDDGRTANLGLWYYEGSEASYTWCLSSVNSDGVIDLSTPASEIFILGEANEDPVEYSQEYWANQYPDANICPFYINVDGEDVPYYWISSLVAEDSIAAWAETPMNWNGWHMVGDKLVDKEEKHAITEDSMNMSFSSFCTYETEPFDASEAGGSGKSGNAGSASADWPYGDAIPAPDAGCVVSVEIESGVYSAIMHWTLEDYEAYVQQLKDAGYTNVITESSNVIYMYSASNGDYLVTVSLNSDYEDTESNGALIISKM